MMSAVDDLPAPSAVLRGCPGSFRVRLVGAACAAAAPWLVPVARLAAHPGNVREDLELWQEFCASVAAGGVRVPLLVTAATVTGTG